MLRRTSKNTNTLIFEPLGVFFKIVNPKDSYELGDQQLKQHSFVLKNTIYLITIMIFEPVLLWHLKKLAKDYELVIYSILPKKLLDDILSPDIRNLFSHVLSYEQLVSSNESEYSIKDLTLLSQNRFVTGKSYIVDCFGPNTCVDQNYKNFIRVKEY